MVVFECKTRWGAADIVCGTTTAGSCLRCRYPRHQHRADLGAADRQDARRCGRRRVAQADRSRPRLHHVTAQQAGQISAEDRGRLPEAAAAGCRRPRLEHGLRRRRSDDAISIGTGSGGGNSLQTAMALAARPADSAERPGTPAVAASSDGTHWVHAAEDLRSRFNSESRRPLRGSGSAGYGR